MSDAVAAGEVPTTEPAARAACDLLIGLNAVIGTACIILAWRRYGRERATEGAA